jgi:TetR/AcrR family transcriptional regulator, repressor for uid operon
MLTVTSTSKDTRTTDRILDAAYDELLAFGFKRVSVEDIAKRCGVARVTIYRRFKSKDELLAAVALREGRRLFDQVEAAIAPSSDREQQLVDGFAAVLDALRRHPLVTRILQSEPELATSFVADQAGPIIGFARDFAVQRLDLEPAVAEMIARLTASFVLIPDSAIKLKTTDDARAFARAYLVPMVRR